MPQEKAEDLPQTSRHIVHRGTKVAFLNDSDNEGELFIHEIILDEDIDPDEGDEIFKELSNSFDEVQFTFEASIEV